MRKLVVAVVAVIVLAGAAVGARWVYHRMFRDPMQQAHALLAKGDLQGAALELREAVQRNPANAEAQARLGGLQILLGDPVAAERELQAARSAGYKGPDLLPMLAHAILAQRRGNEVLAQFRPDGLPPTEAADLLVTRGLAHLAARDPEAARGSAEAAEWLAPKLAEAALLAARAAIAERQPGWALASLDRALRLKPDLTQALLLKAGVLRAEARPEEALPVLAAAEASAKIPLDLAAARLSLAGALLAAGEDAKALADLDRLLKQFPKSPGGNFLKALAQIRAKDWAGADATMEAIQPVLMRLPRGQYYLALVKANRNQLEQAADAITHYTARFPADPDGWRLLARIDLLAGRKDEAGQALARLVGLPPSRTAGEVSSAAAVAETPRELTRLASLQIGAGDTTAAEQELERSLELLPSPANRASRAVMTSLRIGDIDRANAALATLRRQPQASPAEIAALTGAIRLALLDLDGARAAFTEGLKVAPDAVPLKLDLARVLLLQGHPEDAEAVLAPVLQAHPASTLVLATMVEIYGAEKRMDRIQAAITAAHAAAPTDPAPLLLAMELMVQNGDLAGAASQLDTAPPELAHLPAVQALHASVLIRLRRFKDAIDVDRQRLAQQPRNFAVRRELMNLLLGDHQNDAAIALIRDGLQAQPGDSALLLAYVSATQHVSGTDAALALAAKLRQDPANLPAAHLLKGEVLMAAGRPADAAAADAAEVQAVAPFGALVIAEASALRAAGRIDEARKTLTDWIARQPAPTVADALASLEIEAKRMDAAAAALDKVLAMRPDDPVALNNLAWVYQQQNKPDAVTLARRAYLIAPGGETADTLGWILTQQKQPALGILLLRQAALRLPRDPTVYYHLAVALNDTGKPQDAARVLDAILASKLSFAEREAAQKLRQQLGPPAATATPAAATAK